MGLVRHRGLVTPAGIGERLERWYRSAYADMLLVDGNPLENIELVGHPETSFVLIMKDGTIYKNIVK